MFHINTSQNIVLLSLIVYILVTGLDTKVCCVNNSSRDTIIIVADQNFQLLLRKLTQLHLLLTLWPDNIFSGDDSCEVETEV
jgi:hypothetical protein